MARSDNGRVKHPKPSTFTRPMQILFPEEGTEMVEIEEERVNKSRGGKEEDIVQRNIKNASAKRKESPLREVSAFSIQTSQRNARARSLSSSRSRRSIPNDANTQETWNLFRKLWDGGELPVRIDHGGQTKKKLKWFISPFDMKDGQLHQLIPKIALGLPLIDQPYRFVAERALYELIEAASPQLLLDILPELVRSIRAGLYSFDFEKKKTVMEILIKLSKKGEIGEELVPFYRQLLPPFRTINYSGVNKETVYSRGKQVEAMIETTLNELERNGGPNAYINIKYIIPHYDSCRMF